MLQAGGVLDPGSRVRSLSGTAPAPADPSLQLSLWWLAGCSGGRHGLPALAALPDELMCGVAAPSKHLSAPQPPQRRTVQWRCSSGNLVAMHFLLFTFCWTWGVGGQAGREAEQIGENRVEGNIQSLESKIPDPIGSR